MFVWVLKYPFVLIGNLGIEKHRVRVRFVCFVLLDPWVPFCPDGSTWSTVKRTVKGKGGDEKKPEKIKRLVVYMLLASELLVCTCFTAVHMHMQAKQQTANPKTLFSSSQVPSRTCSHSLPSLGSSHLWLLYRCEGCVKSEYKLQETLQVCGLVW